MTTILETECPLNATNPPNLYKFNIKGSVMKKLLAGTFAMFVIALLLISYSLPVVATAANSKSTTVWSGTVLLPDGYIVGAQDVLIVQELSLIHI